MCSLERMKLISANRAFKSLAPRIHSSLPLHKHKTKQQASMSCPSLDHGILSRCTDPATTSAGL